MAVITMDKDIPRRCFVEQMTPAERTILAATEEVEKLGPDTRLTDAVILLSQARSKVADVIDERLQQGEH